MSSHSLGRQDSKGWTITRVGEDAEKRTPSHVTGGNVATLENSLAVPPKVNRESPHDPVILVLRMHPAAPEK